MAVTKDAQGKQLTGRTVNWSSDNTPVASISTAGLVSGVTAGKAGITATSEGKTGTTQVTVLGPVATVTVSPSTFSSVYRYETELSVLLKDAASNTVVRPVTWSSSAPAVASVESSGLVTGGAEGTATITATSEGRTGTATVTVAPAGQIIYHQASLSSGEPALWTINADGTGADEILPGGSDPAISPDGLRLAFTCGNSICVANANGTGQSTLPGSAGEYEAYPDWSPDGSKLVFLAGVILGQPTQRVIRIINANGTNKVTIVQGQGHVGAPRWSPLGDRIAFACDGALCLVEPDGTDLERTSYAPDSPLLEDVAWSPDGQKLVAADNGQAQGHLLLIAMDGGATTRILLPGGANGSRVERPAWSPEGLRIAYAWAPDGFSSNVSTRIRFIGVNGRGLTNVTDVPPSSETYGNPRWIP